MVCFLSLQGTISATDESLANAIHDDEMLSFNAAREIPNGAIFAGDLDHLSREIKSGLRQSQRTPWMLRNLSLLNSRRDIEARSDLGLHGSSDLKSFLAVY